jgi:hypothetical protein
MFGKLDKKNSPLFFRNFLTFVTAENFTQEFLVNDSFYVDKDT